MTKKLYLNNFYSKKNYKQIIPTDGVKAIAVLRGFYKDSVISGKFRDQKSLWLL